MSDDPIEALRTKVARLKARRDVPRDAPAFSLAEVQAALEAIDARIKREREDAVEDYASDNDWMMGDDV